MHRHTHTRRERGICVCWKENLVLRPCSHRAAHSAPVCWAAPSSMGIKPFLCPSHDSSQLLLLFALLPNICMMGCPAA